jgi:hypothetical protein
VTVEPIDYDPLENDVPFVGGIFICGDLFREEDYEGYEEVVGYNLYYDLGDIIGIAEIFLDPFDITLNQITKISFNKMLTYNTTLNLN